MREMHIGGLVRPNLCIRPRSIGRQHLYCAVQRTSEAPMASPSAITAAETPAANGHGEAHSTATFKALMLGSIGVVYGDIGTSPLYALREAIVAASGTGGVDPQA